MKINFQSGILSFLFCAAITFTTIFLWGCDTPGNFVPPNLNDEQEALFQLLGSTAPEAVDQQFAIVNQIAVNMYSGDDTDNLILFLTDYVDKHPENPYNSYWLLMTAMASEKQNSIEAAAYFYKKILNFYPDLTVQGKSIYQTCLEKLITAPITPEEKVKYYSMFISLFPKNEDIAKYYFMLARAYEETGEWKLSIQTYSTYLSYKEASNIQIPGIPNAYSYAKKLVSFNNSPKDWTLESLDDLVNRIKKNLTTGNAQGVEQYRAKVNFFAMSWPQDATDDGQEVDFTMKEYMNKKRIRCAETIDKSSNSTEAYLRTWGWENGMTIWYLYFRKVNFPADPDIHGQWEWAGIYYGEKL